MSSNTYWILRHGESLANVQGLIICDPASGCTGWGLSDSGRLAVEAGLRAHLAGSGSAGSPPDSSAQSGATDAGTAGAERLGPATLIICSDFLRARETAEIAARVCQAAAPQPTPALRERNFGQLHGQPDTRYPEIWAYDARQAGDSAYPPGVESPLAVARRLAGLLAELEQAHSRRQILLVSHGDILQICQAWFAGLPVHRHRELPHLDKGELRRLGACPAISPR